MIDKIKFISAGAGSGKTFALTEKLYEQLSQGNVASSRVIATTFSIKSAAELRERVRQKLLEKGDSQLACQMEDALIGTVNSVCGQLLERFSFEAGLSPELSVIGDKEGKHLFNQAMEMNLSSAKIQTMNRLAKVLGHDDWRANVKAIAELARSNNIDTESLSAMGQKSLDAMMAHFPASVDRDISENLASVLQTAITEIDGQQKGTKAYVSYIKGAQHNLKSNTLPWSDWVKLAKSTPKPTKNFHQYSDAIAQIAMDYDRHSALHQDIKSYSEGLFDIASASLEHFQKLKKQRGLIDFVDQEQLLLNLLEDESVQSRLSSELDLLMVDEFQDTSPIQLTLFLKLANCANQVYFVGDIKQSIYGFRGSDPSLMLAVVNEIKKQGGSIENLENSYRSCESLVHYTNALFTEAFLNTLKPEQIILHPTRKNVGQENVLEHWQLQGSTKEARANALAVAVKEKIAAQRDVFDNQTQSVRTLKISDIAILARTNDNVEEIASALTAHGIAVQTAQSKLIGTAEASLVLACIRRLIDKDDTLASAEIISLSKSTEPEVWLKDRLSYLAAEKNSTEWGESENSLLMALKELRKSASLYTPTEIVQYIIINLNIRGIVNQWGPTPQRNMQRLKNLDRLMASVGEYEQFCLTTGNVASLPGLVIWWNNLAAEDEDEQASVKDQEAVHILTYHGAKGLEWPLVILFDLNKVPKTRIWQPRVINTQKCLNIQSPLEAREIVYWVWPFGQQKTNIPVKESIEDTKTGKQSLADTEEEEKRLLYVGATRARDSLILITDNTKGMVKGGWLALTNADWVLPDSKTLNLPDKTRIKTDCQPFEAIVAVEASTNYKPQWFEENLLYTEKRYESLSPSAAVSDKKSTVGELISMGERLTIHGGPDMADFGNILHGIIAAKFINQSFHIDDVKALLNRSEMAAFISPEDALMAAEHLKRHIDKHYPNAKYYAEYPVEQRLDNGQVVRGWIDLLIETDQGWIICDHKSSPKKKSELKKIALEYSGQLKMYKDAVNAASNKPVLSTLIHFPVSSCIAEITL